MLHGYSSAKIVHVTIRYLNLNVQEADIPEDRLIYAEAMYDVSYLNKKKLKKNYLGGGGG